MAVSSERESELGHQRVEVNNKAVMVTTGVSDPESSHNGVYCEYLIFVCISQRLSSDVIKLTQIPITVPASALCYI